MPNSLTDKVNKYFDADKKVSKESLEIITWFVYQLEENRQHDLWLLAKLLSEKDITKLVAYFSGDSIKFPTKDKYIELRLVSVCFFLKEIQGWDWVRIRTFLGMNENDKTFSSLSLGHRVNKVKEHLVNDIKKTLVKCERKDDYFVLKDYINSVKKERKKVTKEWQKKQK